MTFSSTTVHSLLFVLLIVGCSPNDTRQSSGEPWAANQATARETTTPQRPCSDPATAQRDELMVEDAEVTEEEIVEELTVEDWLEESKELRYAHCDPEHAEVIVVLSAEIPSFEHDLIFRVPLRRQMISKWRCHRNLGLLAACGRGFGSLSSLCLRDATDSSVDLELSYSWTSEKSRGKFKEALPITIGEPGSQQTDHMINIRWDFEEPGDGTEQVSYW